MGMLRPREEYEILGIQFSDEGVLIDYVCLPTDVRGRKGELMMRHSLMVEASSHPDYIEQVSHLNTTAILLLRECLEDFDDSEPYVPPKPLTPEEEDEGMGAGVP